ncbi:MAG: hypothetical protein ACAH59_06555 [Pseudobdellovibrionaceae bacterium]
MNSFRLFWLVVLIGFSVHAADRSSSSGRFNFRQKAESKAGSRWTLQEWLEQKERNHMMDLWLAMYAPSPYEFYLKGSYHTFKTKLDPATVEEKEYQSYSGGLGAYATIIGIEGDYENNSQEKYNDLSGALNLRILGNAVQGTHLSLHYGLRTREGEDATGSVVRFSNPYAGADLNLYLTKYFGLQGRYNQYLATEEVSLGTITGSRTEGGLFIDFGPVRVFGNWFSDMQKNDKAGVISTIQRTGIQSGLKFFF